MPPAGRKEGRDCRSVDGRLDEDHVEQGHNDAHQRSDGSDAEPILDNGNGFDDDIVARNERSLHLGECVPDSNRLVVMLVGGVQYREESGRIDKHAHRCVTASAKSSS